MLGSQPVMRSVKPQTSQILSCQCPDSHRLGRQRGPELVMYPYPPCSRVTTPGGSLVPSLVQAERKLQDEYGVPGMYKMSMVSPEFNVRRKVIP
jgi:hypothetical protein